MKRADAEKKMTAIKESIEKMYPGVHAEVRTNEWAKGSYSRLYIDLSCKAAVNGKEKEFVARFGFVNLKTNRYNKGTYDMCHFDASYFGEAKALHDYAQAYQDAKNDKNKYTPDVGYRVIFGLSEEELENGISRKEMLDKSFDNGVDFDNLEKVWIVVDRDDVVTTESDFGATDKCKNTENVQFSGSTYRVLRKYGKNPTFGEAVKIGERFSPFGAVEKYRIVWDGNKVKSVELAGEKVWRVPK